MSAGAVLDAYYMQLERIEAAKKHRDFDTMLRMAVETCERLGSFVDAWREEELEIFDGVLPDDWFRIQSIPAITAICQLAPCRLDEQHLQETLRQLDERPQLGRFAGEVEDALGRLELARRVYDVIEAEPGVKQSGLGKRLGADSGLVREILYWAELDGRVRREKAGSTYALWLAGVDA